MLAWLFTRSALRGLFRFGIFAVAILLFIGLRQSIALAAVSDGMAAPARVSVQEALAGAAGDPLDIVEIPAKGNVVSSTIVLDAGVRYSVVITGVYRFNSGVPGQLADAQYRQANDEQWVNRWNSVQFDGVGLDAYRGDLATHTYIYYIVGTGNHLGLNIYDEPNRYGDNVGSLTASIALVTGASVFGQVRDEEGNPLPGVIIATNALTTTTDGDGNYALYDLTAGTYTITPTAELWAFDPPTTTVTVPPDVLNQNFTAVWPARLFLPAVLQQQ